jgi:O-antigen ligase
VQSIYNISTDASNTERINRWHSALRMFNERPVFGWGPNTYMFEYSSFQLSNEMTIISVRGGTQGNAHSEYIGPLAEEGVLGMVSAISLIFISLVKAMQLIYKGRDNRIRLMAMACILGLITYFVHGLINDYLDQDKAAVPVFAMMAIITALDIYYQRNIKPENKVIIEGEKAK